MDSSRQYQTQQPGNMSISYEPPQYGYRQYMNAPQYSYQQPMNITKLTKSARYTPSQYVNPFAPNASITPPLLPENRYQIDAAESVEGEKRIEGDDRDKGKGEPTHEGSHFKHMTISRDQTQASMHFIQQLAVLLESKHELQQQDSGTEEYPNMHKGSRTFQFNTNAEFEPVLNETPSLSDPDFGPAKYFTGQEPIVKRNRAYPESRPTKPSLAISPRNYSSRDDSHPEDSRRSSISSVQDLSKSPSNRSIDGRKVSAQQVGTGEVEDRTIPPKSDPGIDHSIVERLTDRIRALEIENHKLTTQSEAMPLRSNAASITREHTWNTFYRLDGEVYLYEPTYAKGEQEIVYLKGTSLVKDIGRYLDRHPEICFTIYKDYDSEISTNILRSSSVDEGIFQAPIPIKQSLQLKSKEIFKAVGEFLRYVPNFPGLFPDFNLNDEIEAPYLFFYYTKPMIAEILPRLKDVHWTLISLLFRCVLDSHGKEYQQARQDFQHGLVSNTTMPYLIYPGEVLIEKKEKHFKPYMAKSWGYKPVSAIPRLPREFPYYFEDAPMKSQKAGDEEEGETTWEISCWSWYFNGAFEKKNQTQKISLAGAKENKKVRIVSLDLYPFRYADNETKELFQKRGRTFWRCRSKNFVSFQAEEEDTLNTAGERFMIDNVTYKLLHPESAKSKELVHDDIGPEIMACEEPPQDDTLLLFPPIITGYNMRLKKWVDLEVDRISDVVWNTQAFESLVVDDDMKELIQALITNQLASEKSTDLITGKGNGLIILLHGGPGTGKTFTAESVAEIAKKPLYRVTCGDIGTKPEDVEKYLESVLHLGKIWGCIVLLDEADVFLEERTLADLQRNALVSVFLRVLEYYDGILILTSNRVGTFDEAFKSRIQLALRYENLTLVQRRQIWRNFMNRLKAIGETRIDHDDIWDHIDELAQEEMNGRQIRNAITTARQLAQYKGKDFSYVHLRHVINVAGKFDNYLKGVKEGYTDDQLARDGGLR